MKKDIVLIIGGGGMSGIFSAGVLKTFEDSLIFARVHSIYAVSVGACTGARFLARESELGGKTFYTRFNNKRFLQGHFVRYFFQILFRKKQPKDILNFDYFTDVLHNSEDRIDMQKVLLSGTPFYVKVFNANKHIHEYLRVEEPNAYNKVLASASMTPLTSKQTTVNGEEFFDGDTIASNLETEVARVNPDKLIIKINNGRSSVWSMLLSLLISPIIYTLLLCMYNTTTANLYFKNFFKRFSWDRSLVRMPNVILVGNNLPISAFEKDAKLLKKVYEHGLRRGAETLQHLRRR